jgi:hypothetical protein
MRKAMRCSVCGKWFLRSELYQVLSVTRMFMCDRCFEDFFWDTELSRRERRHPEGFPLFPIPLPLLQGSLLLGVEEE